MRARERTAHHRLPERRAPRGRAARGGPASPLRRAAGLSDRDGVRAGRAGGGRPPARAGGAQAARCRQALPAPTPRSASGRRARLEPLRAEARRASLARSAHPGSARPRALLSGSGAGPQRRGGGPHEPGTGGEADPGRGGRADHLHERQPSRHRSRTLREGGVGCGARARSRRAALGSGCRRASPGARLDHRRLHRTRPGGAARRRMGPVGTPGDLSPRGGGR